MTNDDYYSSFYEITVLGNSHLKYPIYYLTDITEYECYTGKEHNKVYLIYEKNQDIMYNIVINAYIPDKSDSYLTIGANPLDKSNYFNLNSIKDWQSSFIYKRLNKEGEPFLEISYYQFNGAALIQVEVPTNDTKINIIMCSRKAFIPFYMIPYSTIYSITL